MNEADARKLATEIADELFTSRVGTRAVRLVLEGENKRDLGGWGKDAVIARLTRWLQVPRKAKKP